MVGIGNTAEEATFYRSIGYLGIWCAHVGIVHIGASAISGNCQRWYGTILIRRISIGTTSELPRWIVSVKTNLSNSIISFISDVHTRLILLSNQCWMKNKKNFRKMKVNWKFQRKKFQVKNLMKQSFFLQSRFAIMAYCWALSPLERPSFGQLQVCLQEFHTQLTRYI